MALGFTDGSLQFVDATTGEMIRELTLGGHSDGITCLAFSTDGLRVVSGTLLGELALGRAVRLLPHVICCSSILGLSVWITGLSGLAPGSHDAKLVVWDALTGTWLADMVVHMRSITSVVWLESDGAKKKSGTPGFLLPAWLFGVWLCVWSCKC